MKNRNNRILGEGLDSHWLLQSTKMLQKAKKEIHSIHSYKGHTPGRPVNLKEILHTQPQLGLTPWLLSSWKLKGQYIQINEEQLRSVGGTIP